MRDINTDIFVSYQHKDLDAVKQLVDLWQLRGWSVYWDQSLAPGEDWAAELQEALGAAKCVVVIWSRNSVNAEGVLREARRAAELQKLIPVTLDGSIAGGFTDIYTTSLSDWDGSPEHPSATKLVNTISKRVKLQKQEPGKKTQKKVSDVGTSSIWMFQAARTEKFAEFLRGVSPEDPQHWWLSKFAKTVQAGDLVYLWQAGSEEALCGWGHIAKAPYQNPDKPKGTTTKVAAKDEKPSYLSSPYRLDYLVKTVFDKPVTRGTINAHSALGTRFLRKIAFGGVTKLTREEAIALNELIKKSGQPLPPPLKEGAAVRVWTDNPAPVDWLRRKPFAVAIANHLKQVIGEQGAKRNEKATSDVGLKGDVFKLNLHDIWRAGKSWLLSILRNPLKIQDAKRNKIGRSGTESEGNAFILHLYGPWGSGKSSLLNFLRDDLTSGREKWIIVWFNAWRKQRTGPAWWALITSIFRQSMTQLEDIDSKQRWRLRLKHWAWQLYTGPLPLSVMVISLFYFFIVFIVLPMLPGAPLQAMKEIKTVLDVVAGFGTVISLALSVGRYLLLGSPKTASMYMQLAQDPQQSIVDHFEQMVGEMKHPIAVLIDDLDRCDSDYVIELLHDIQTLFRRANVQYVVAADKQWLRSSYESVYKDFKQCISEPGRPLGYLFLEKIFQVSLPVPTLSARKQKEYLDRLLTPESATSERKAQPEISEETRKEAKKAARVQLGDTLDEEKLANKIKLEKNTAIRDAMISEAVDRVTSAEARERAEKFLKGYADMMEANPRSMKRLINLFAFRQALNLIEERVVSNHHVALWVIIEHRWPELADLLIEQPELADQILTMEPSSLDISPELKEFFEKEKDEVRLVLRGAGKYVGTRGGLSSKDVQELFGLSEEASF